MHDGVLKCRRFFFCVDSLRAAHGRYRWYCLVGSDEECGNLHTYDDLKRTQQVDIRGGYSLQCIANFMLLNCNLYLEMWRIV